MTRLNLGIDARGATTFALQFPDKNLAYSAILPTSSAISVTVPKTYPRWQAVFSYEAGSNVWVANNNTAAGPVGGTFAVTNSVRNPIIRMVDGGDVLSFFTPDTGVEVGVEFHAL